MSTQTQNFSADVSRLLDIVANALYTNHDVFLRELISNAADACDRLRYDAIQNSDLIKDNPNFRIHIYKDTDARTLTVVDNGVGMTKEDLAENLGTIAKSGTAALMKQVSEAGEGKDKLSLIGQFGVGFYAAYMVADKVTVISRRAGNGEIWAWESDGRTGFTLREPTAQEIAKLDGERGTAIIVHIKNEGVEFLLDEKIKQTVETYSDHIDVKIFLNVPADTARGEGKPANSATAIWMRPKAEITKDEYTNFYKHITHGFDEPVMTSHWKAEGKIEYSALLFVPMMRPWDLYDPSRRHTVKLYVKRVFISEALDGLMYPWLRFLRGVIDSADLPLNISRESLQYNPLIAKIRSGVTRKILGDLDKLSREDSTAFTVFWGQFGAVLKEGLYDAAEHREDLFKVCRFFSTHEDGEKYVSLDDYIARMKDGQQEIYYISGESVEAVKASPQIEGLRARYIEVLFFIDAIDDFWRQQVTEYKGKAFKSVTKGDIDFGKISGEDEGKTIKETPEETRTLAARIKEILQDEVDDVRLSKRLTDSPVCLVTPESGVDMHMERVLKLQQKYAGETKPVLEINGDHPLIRRLAAINDNAELGDAARLLLDQARIIQGIPIRDTAGFTRRMSALMQKGF